MAITLAADVTTIESMFDQMARFDLRPELYFDAVADVRQGVFGPSRGGSATFPLWDDLPEETTELTDGTDVTPVTLSDRTVVVPIVEQGNAVEVSKKLVAQSYVQVVSDVANLVGWNAGLSVDGLARDILFAGTNVTFVGQATQAAITATDVFTTAAARAAIAALRTASSKPHGNGNYAAFIHPDVSVDLRAETGGAGWHEPANYSGVDRRWNGEIGVFDGASYIETPRCPLLADAGATTTDVYQTVICGQQGMAKAVLGSEAPEFIIGPIVDRLRRNWPFGWFQLVGYGIYREESLFRIESASSIGANA